MAKVPAFANKPAGGGPPVPPSGVAAIFAGFVAHARSTLHGWTILAHDNPSLDASLPSGEGPPWVRLTPMPATSKPYSRGPRGVVHRTPMTIAVELSTAGTNVARSMDAWQALCSAVYPPPAALGQLGVSSTVLGKPAWGPPPAGGDRCEGKGELTLIMYTQTPE